MKTIKSLGLEISPLKTHKSKCLFEFAKRLYLNGEQITPFPISSLKESGKSAGMLTTTLLESIDKGWDFPSVSLSVSRYFGIVKNMPSRYQKIQEEKS